METTRHACRATVEYAEGSALIDVPAFDGGENINQAKEKNKRCLLESKAQLESARTQEPNQESLDSVREAEEIIAKGRLGYASPDEMFEAMEG